MKNVVTSEGTVSASVPDGEYDVWEWTCICIDFRDSEDRQRSQISQSSEFL